MIEVAYPSLAQDRTRVLLRKLRDLNLSAGPIAVTPGARVALAGCASTDDPAERGVRYRMRLGDGSDGTLEIHGRPEGLELRLCGPRGAAERRLLVAVTCDRLGRACARALGARVVPETHDARELEHFLRRIVRTLLSGGAARGC
jgi:hypothetical protein